MRTIKGWTNEEIKALKRLKDGGYDSSIYAWVE